MGTGCANVGRQAIIAPIVIAILLAAVPAASAREALFGYSDDPDTFEASGNLIERSDSAVGRVQFLWTDLEPKPGSYAWNEMDAVYNHLLAAGARPLFVVYGSPEWAQSVPQSGVRPPDDLSAWSDLWSTLARRYPDAIWQVWNEPNHPFYGGDVGLGRIVQLVRLAAQSVHAVDPNARVIGPATSPGVGNWKPYLKAMYRKLGGRIEVAVNVYPRIPSTWKRDFRAGVNFAERVAGDRRLWVTETGLSREQYGGRRQARGSAWMYRRVDRDGLAGIIFHRLAAKSDTTEWDKGLAVTADFKPLRVFRALRRAVERPPARP